MNDMVPRPSTGLSLCSGGGGLDMGLELAEPGYQTACYVEWEEYPRRVLTAAQGAGYSAPAPIWDDLKTFDARPWRNLVDTVTAGYPCQPFSQAGQRRGEDDERHLWPHVARIIIECEPRWVLLENVAGHVTLGGEAVLRALWDMGYTPAVGLFSAGETGATHQRLRWFCVAYRQSVGERKQNDPISSLPWRHARRGSGRGGLRPHEGLDHTTGTRRDDARGGAGSERESGERLLGSGRPELGNAHGPFASEERQQRGGQLGRHTQDHRASEARRDLANAGSARTAPWRSNQVAGGEGIANQPVDNSARIHPPAPSDADAWGAVLRSTPDRAPAISRRDIKTAALRFASLLPADATSGTEPGAREVAGPGFASSVERKAAQVVGGREALAGVRGMADGLALRSRALKLLGNGVHPLAAANAWRALSSAHGLRPVDLEASSEGSTPAGTTFVDLEIK